MTSLQRTRPRVAVHKFSSCDGCQLAFLNLGEPLLELWDRVEVLHFAEAGALDPDAEVDVAFVEGSISTADEVERIRAVRAHARYLVAIGACATSGGIQALRNGADADWFAAVYADADTVRGLANSDAIAKHVKVDLEVQGCPVTGAQLLAVVKNLLNGVAPPGPASGAPHDSVCMECKRAGNLCVMVTQGRPCLGPVTAAGCGALCPGLNRDCYGCFGPASHCNVNALSRRFAGLGLDARARRRRFAFIHSAADAFATQPDDDRD